MKNCARLDRTGANQTITLDSGAIAVTDADPDPVHLTDGTTVAGNCWKNVTITKGSDVTVYARNCLSFKSSRKMIDRH